MQAVLRIQYTNEPGSEKSYKTSMKKKKKKQAGAMKTAITCSDVEKDSCLNKLESLENVKSKKTGQSYSKVNKRTVKLYQVKWEM